MNKSDVHFLIEQEAASLRTGATPVRDSDELPALAALLSGAREAVEKLLPDRFDYEGKTYYLSVSLGLCRIKVFDNPAKATPLVHAVSGGFDEFGHTPQH